MFNWDFSLLISNMFFAENQLAINIEQQIDKWMNPLGVSNDKHKHIIVTSNIIMINNKIVQPFVLLPR